MSALAMEEHSGLFGSFQHGYNIAILLVCAPALSMAIGSAAVRLGMPSERVQARFQNLSAGLLIGALLAEIYPMLRRRFVGVEGSNHVDISNCLSAFVGFVLAVAVMYGLHSLEQSHGDEVPGALEKAASADLEEAPPVLQRVATAQIAKLRSGNSNLELAISALSNMKKSEGDIDVVSSTLF